MKDEPTQVRSMAAFPLAALSAVVGGLLGFVLLAGSIAGDLHWLDRTVLLGLRTPGDLSVPN